MELKELIPIIFAVLFLITEFAMSFKMKSLTKKHENDTVEVLSNKLKPYLCISRVASVLIAICMIVVIIMR